MGLSGISNEIYPKNDVISLDTTAPLDAVNIPISTDQHTDIKSKIYTEFQLQTNEQIEHCIRQTVEKTGVSEKYIRNVLLQEEKIRLKVYDDGVKYNERDTHGTYTVGCGHAKKILGKYIDSPLYMPNVEYEITDKNKDLINLSISDAFEILQTDIEIAKSKAREFFGKSFDEAPLSIRESIVDIVFNKGIENPFIKKIDSPTYLLKEDLEKGDYYSAALHTVYQTQRAGLKKRNMFRFLHAITDLTKEEKEQAIEDMKSEYNKTADALRNTGLLGILREKRFLYQWNIGVQKLGL